jgi:hypothetical protein
MDNETVSWRRFLLLVFSAALALSACSGDGTTVTDGGTDADLGPVPSVAGTYEVFFILPALDPPPPELLPAHDFVREVFTDTGTALLRWLALEDAGQGYPEEAPWSLLFSCQSPGCALPGPTAVGSVVAAVMEAKADEVVASDMSIDADTLDQALAEKHNRLANLEDSYLAGVLEIAEEPGEDLQLGENAITIQTIGYHWGGTGAVSFRDYGYREIPSVAASLEGTAGPAPGWGGRLESITLPVGYVERLTILVEILIMEGWGVGELYEWLFDCADLADHIACQGAYAADPTCNDAGAPAAPAIEAACSQLQLSSWGRFAELAELTTGGYAESRVATPSGEACLIVTQDSEAQSLGNLSSHCALVIDLHQNATVVDTRPGTWYATRQ